MSERTRRLDHLLTEEISRVLAREVRDPRIGFVTITGVEVSADLRHATVWASVIGDERERRTTIRALERAMPYVRRRLGELRLKRIPDLHVREDDSAQRGTRVMELLERLEAQEAGGSVDPDAVTAALSPPTLPTPGPVRAADDPGAAGPVEGRGRARPGTPGRTSRPSDRRPRPAPRGPGGRRDR